MLDEYEKLVKKAAWTVCPWCDAPKCLGKNECPAIKTWVEREKTEKEYKNDRLQ